MKSVEDLAILEELGNMRKSTQKLFTQPSATNLEYVYNGTQKAVKYTSIKSKNLISIQFVRHLANPELIPSHRYTEQHLIHLQMYLSIYNRGLQINYND